MKMNNKLFTLIFIVIILFGVCTKLYYAYNLSAYMDGDPATVGLMAGDVLNGKFSTFFYGQNYNGVLEIYWLAPFVLILGHNAMALYIGMIGLFIVFLLTIYWLGCMVCNKYTGLWAMAYCAVSTYPLLHNSVFPYGYHMGLLVFGNLVLILTLFIDKHERSYKGWIALGLCAGLGFWNHFSIVYYLAPAALFLCFKKNLFKNFKFYIISAVSFIVGSLPFWIHNLQTRLSSFNIRDGKPYSDYPVDLPLIPALKRIFEYHFSAILGIQDFNWAAAAVWVIFLLAVLLFLIQINRKKLLLVFFAFSFIGFSLWQKFFVLSPKYCYFIPAYAFTAVVFGYLIWWFNSKLKYSGILLLLLLLAFNMNDYAISVSEGRYKAQDKQIYDLKAEQYNALIEFLNENNIDVVFGEFYTVQALNFMTGKEILGTDIMDNRTPLDEFANAKDNLAVINYFDFYKPSLDVLCEDYEIKQVGPYKAAYNFKPYKYKGKDITTNKWKGKSNYNNKAAGYAYDRNLSKSWTTETSKAPDMYYELDLGEVYTVYKLMVVNIEPELNNYAPGYKIESSIDGKNWELVREGENAQPMFWSGPRIYRDYYNGRWDVVFKPVIARYMRITQTGYGTWQWMINEVFVYEYVGNDTKELSDWVQSAEDVYQFVLENKIDFVYADFWLSAKINDWSNGNIKTLQPKNDCHPKRAYTDRLMEVNRDTAIVIDKAEEENFEEVLNMFNLPVNKKDISPFICYLFKNLNKWQRYFLKNQKCLYWLGFTMAEINLIQYSQILTAFGINLKNSGDAKQAVNFYKKAIDISTTNNIARERLADYYKTNNMEAEYNNELKELKNICYPDNEKVIVFKKNIRFLGYTFKKEGNLLNIDYFWELPKKNPNGLVVFVYFIKDGTIMFQGDYPFFPNYKDTGISLKGWISKEHTIVDIPKDISSGTYKIIMGIYMPQKKGKRLRIKSTGSGSLSKVEIGKIEL